MRNDPSLSWKIKRVKKIAELDTGEKKSKKKQNINPRTSSEKDIIASTAMLSFSPLFQKYVVCNFVLFARPFFRFFLVV